MNYTTVKFVLSCLFYYKNTSHFTSLHFTSLYFTSHISASRLKKLSALPQNVQVQAILRPTVSRSVRLGVVPLLKQVRRYISLSDNYNVNYSNTPDSINVQNRSLIMW
jgi:hypothetical protein